MSIWQGIGATLAGIACMTVSGVVLLVEPLIGTDLTHLAYYVVAMGSSVLVATWIRGLPLARSSFDCRLPDARSSLLFVLGGVVLLLGLVGPVTSLIPMSDADREWFAELIGQTGVATFIAFVVAAPILEEFLFRGVMIDGLLRRYRPWVAILVSSTLFGAMHLNSWQFVTGLFFGAFTGWVYFRSRSLVACVLIHATANGTGYVLRLYADPESFLPPESPAGGGSSEASVWSDALSSLLTFGVGGGVFALCIWALARTLPRHPWPRRVAPAGEGHGSEGAT